MKTTNEILAETGLTYPMLNRLKDLGIIPRPRLKGRGRRKGVVGVFDDDIIGIISEVKSQQKSGLSLTQIAASRRGVPAPTPFEKREVTRVTPQNPAVMSNYIDTAPELFEQVENENPDYELHAIRMVVVKGESKKYLVPVELELTPKE
ncbi:MAG: hypothetical protein PVG61_04665 [Dehalococcoidia bacterium]|jgi:DNA-binding transcriptional MerR regulator